MQNRMPNTQPPSAQEQVCDIAVELTEIKEIGAGRAGQRRIIAIVGGSAVGPLLNGRLLSVGADWLTILSSGLAELDT